MLSLKIYCKKYYKIRQTVKKCIIQYVYFNILYNEVYVRTKSLRSIVLSDEKKIVFSNSYSLIIIIRCLYTEIIKIYYKISILKKLSFMLR